MTNEIMLPLTTKVSNGALSLSDYTLSINQCQAF